MASKALPRGGSKRLSRSHLVHSRTHRFPLLLIVLASMTSLTFSGFIPLFSLFLLLWLTPFPPSCVHMLSASAAGCLELDSRQVGSGGRRWAVASLRRSSFSTCFAALVLSSKFWNLLNSPNSRIQETYFLAPPSPSASLHLTFYSLHFAINLLFVLSNELIRVS